MKKEQVNNLLFLTSGTGFETKLGNRDIEAKANDRMLIEAVLTPHECRAKQLLEQVDDDRREIARHIMQIFMHDDPIPEQELANDRSLATFVDALEAEELD
ncbi:MAG TPA: hypothetical protein VFA65_09100 [Bryobacteraceae bacterium]|nr:hypothetical protein [Bryobacteraceae bacterium]